MGNYSIPQLLMWLLVVAGAIGIVFVVLQVAGIIIPAFVWKIFLICAAVGLGILAIGWLATLINRTPPPTT